MKSRVIFASLVLGLGLVANQATAATTLSDDSPAANKTANALLATGTQKQLASYMERNFSRFAKKSDWKGFFGVVAQYSENPTGVLSFTADEQNKFNQSAAIVDRRLARENSAEAIAWKGQATGVVRMINFIWNVQANQSQLADNE